MVKVKVFENYVKLQITRSIIIVKKGTCEGTCEIWKPSIAVSKVKVFVHMHANTGNMTIARPTFVPAGLKGMAIQLLTIHALWPWPCRFDIGSRSRHLWVVDNIWPQHEFWLSALWSGPGYIHTTLRSGSSQTLVPCDNCVKIHLNPSNQWQVMARTKILLCVALT